MNEKLNIQDLIDLLAEKHGMSKKNADSFVKEFFQLIEEALEKDKYVKVKGLGAFKLIDVESRSRILKRWCSMTIQSWKTLLWIIVIMRMKKTPGKRQRK